MKLKLFFNNSIFILFITQQFNLSHRFSIKMVSHSAQALPFFACCYFQFYSYIPSLPLKSHHNSHPHSWRLYIQRFKTKTKQTMPQHEKVISTLYTFGGLELKNFKNKNVKCLLFFYICAISSYQPFKLFSRLFHSCCFFYNFVRYK